MGVNVEIAGRENSKELLRPESMVKSLAFGQARWADPLKDLEDRTVWLAKWEMSGRSASPNDRGTQAYSSAVDNRPLVV